MRYVFAVLAGGLLIGLLLSFAVYYLLGFNPGYFFAKFIAGPVGLASAFVIFIAYDHIRPKKNDKD